MEKTMNVLTIADTGHGLGPQALEMGLGEVSFLRPGAASLALCCHPGPTIVLGTQWALRKYLFLW